MLRAALAARCCRATPLARMVLAPRGRRQLCESAAKASESAASKASGAAKSAEAAKAAEAAAESGSLKWLLKEGQVDSGMWQGSALLAVVVGGVAVSSTEQCSSLVSSALGAFHACGIKSELISDAVLVEDHIRKNVAAAINVLMASPVFYFMFAKMHGQSFLVSTLRGVTGTLRIVPFMFAFYGFFGVVVPFVTQYFMTSNGQSYEEAQGTAAVVVMLSGLVFVEALVELRGVGVTFAQMTMGSFLLFIPALVGRLAAGVLTQQQKVGSEAGEPVLPSSWNDADAPTWQQHTYMLAHRLALDREFMVTLVGTSLCQHILNGISWVLLTRGNATRLVDIGAFLLGGMQGTALSGIGQLGKTFVMRLGFSWAWNYATSQPLNMPAFEPFLETKK